jgi:peptidyl-tRNA hydrolase, PTH1 family
MLLIIGLGNPGRQYFSTRHNIGYIIADRLAADLNSTGFRSRFSAEYCRVTLMEKDLLIIKPITFMNNSGNSVAKFFNYYKNDIDGILVLHDDLDIEFGTIKFKSGGSSGGHNGLESIIRSIGNDKFDRLRFGIGRPVTDQDPADYVLNKFNRNESKELDCLIERSLDSIREYVSGGIDHVMNICNKRH